MNKETALQIAARIWCDPDYEHVTMNPDLCEHIAHLLMTESNKQETIKNMENLLSDRSIDA